MDQIEVKQKLAELRFPPAGGWRLSVHLDGMERCSGENHPVRRREAANRCIGWFDTNGVMIRGDEQLGKADFVARHDNGDFYLIEVEGDSSRQPDQAMYSALGQLLIRRYLAPDARIGIAVPDSEKWRRQLGRLPAKLLEDLGLHLFFVGEDSVQEQGLAI